MRSRNGAVIYPRRSVEFGLYVWHNSFVPVLLERFVLAVFATAFVAIVLLNAMKMDWIQRTGLGLGIIGFAIFSAQTIHLFNQSKAVSAPSVKTSPPPSLPKEDEPLQKDVPPRKEKPDNRHPLPIRKIQFTEEIVSSKKEDAPFAVRVVIQTNVPIQPTSLVVRCTSDVQEGEYHMVGVGAFRDGGDGYTGNSHRTFWFFFGDPPFKPDTPIIVLLMAKQSIHVVSVEEGPPR